MAEIVLGIGSSHGPLLSTPPEQWDLRAKADRENKNHWYRGKTYDYAALLQERAPGFADEIVVEKRRERFMKCRAALEVLGHKFNEVAPDAVVIIGNDQREFFNAGLTPAITVYRGKTISNVQHLNEDAPGLNIAEPSNSPEEGATYHGATDLADHILRSTLALAIVFAGLAFLLGGFPAFVGAGVGALVAVANAVFFRWLFRTLKSGAMQHRSALLGLFFVKFGVLATLCYALITKWGVHPAGFAAGYGALVAGALVGAGLATTASTPSSLVREET